MGSRAGSAELDGVALRGHAPAAGRRAGGGGQEEVRRDVRGGHERLQRPQGAQQGDHAGRAQERRLQVRQDRGVAEPRGQEARGHVRRAVQRRRGDLPDRRRHERAHARRRRRRLRAAPGRGGLRGVGGVSETQHRVPCPDQPFQAAGWRVSRDI